MAIKINQIYGYQILYEERSRRFIVQDTDGTELAWGNTQDEAETEAKSLSKQEFHRKSIVRVEYEGEITTGQLTSLNKDDQTAWVSMEKGADTWGRGGREKIRLHYTTGYYEATVTNASILERIKEKGEGLKALKQEIKSLIEILEKPINLDYFGIEK